MIIRRKKFYLLMDKVIYGTLRSVGVNKSLKDRLKLRNMLLKEGKAK